MVRDSSINVCLACDDNYAKYAGVVIASILYNADSADNLCIYILDGGISEENKERIYSLRTIKDCHIEFIHIDSDMFQDYANVKTHKYISIATYYRLKAPTLLPKVDKLIYFDCDIVVNSSLKELYNINLSDYLVAGVSDIKKKDVKKNPYYVNAGMLVMNLAKMRKENTESEFLDYTIKNIDKITKGDQEIINDVCKNSIMVIDSAWNVQVSNFVNRSSYTNSPKVIHYVSSNKPWKYASYSYFKEYWFKYLQLTPWALKEEEKKHWYKDNQIASILAYIKYRPLFLLRPRFYQAAYCTYLKGKFFGISTYKETHNLIKFFGIKIKIPKVKYFLKKSKNLYYYYKKNNVDITKLPPATGQIRDIQLANFELLKEFDYVCKQNNLTYWLDFGTMLGAVRHKGYIPWDDDIDIGMPREDCKKLLEVFDSSTRNPDLEVKFTLDKTNNGLYKLMHRASAHLFVDIFPYDVYGDKLDASQQHTVSNSIKKLRKQYIKNSTKFSISEFTQICDKLRSLILKNSDTRNSDFVYGIEYNHTWKRLILPYDVILPTKLIEFEGYLFPSMQNPHAYLREVYGDYMAYPKKIGMGHSMYTKLSDEEKNIIKNLITPKNEKTKKIVITYGTFDAFHYGHVNLLKRAKALGDYLIVGLSTDEFNELKNKKSYFSYSQRKTMLEACRYVDMVIPENNWDQKINDIKKYNIDTFAMGDNWKDKFDDLKEYCKVVYLPVTPEISTSDLKNQLKEHAIQEIQNKIKPKISIIIPVYNVEKYISRCLNSLINQKLKDIEIICIDDGSTDNSYNIIQSFAKKDSRIKVVQQSNKGVSVARNTGLEIARGEYIAFVDSDDWINWQFCEKLYKSAKKYDADIAVSSVIKNRKGHNTALIRYTKEEVYEDFESKLAMCDIPDHCYIWNKLYKKECIGDMKFEPGCIYEDIIFTPKVIYNANKIVTVPGVHYYYFRHKNSLVKDKSKQARSDKSKANKIMTKFLKDHNVNITKLQTTTKKYKFLGMTIFKVKTKGNKKTYVLLNCITW